MNPKTYFLATMITLSIGCGATSHPSTPAEPAARTLTGVFVERSPTERLMDAARAVHRRDQTFAPRTG